MTNETTALSTVSDFKKVLVSNYKAQLEAQLGDEKTSKAFMANAISIVQQNPKLLECTPYTVFNGLMIMASLNLMPSAISGEAYLIPYRNKGVQEAQFQLGYQGLVTLFYRAGVRSIAAEIVFAKDKFSYTNGVVEHTPDVFSKDRGEAIGAYVIVELEAGGKVYKVMSEDEILKIKNFSKSKGSDFSPWNLKNDPERWMWKKTVLKQAAKLVPKNAAIVRAVDEDNKDSVISDKKENKSRLAAAKEASASMTMGAIEQDSDSEDVIEDEQA